MASEQLNKITIAKNVYDREVAELEAEVRYRKNKAKEAVLAFIKEAAQAGTSMNSIAVKGMGYASPGVTALKNFVGANGTSREAILDAIGGVSDGGKYVSASSGPRYDFREDSIKGGTYYVTDSEGVKRKLYVDDGVVDYGTVRNAADKDDIIASFKAQFGDRFTYGEEK